jgi:predicted AAA+ superfamily ATPase
VETFVLSELVKLRTASDTGFNVYHLRDRDGAEVDFLLEGLDGRVAAIEVKASASPTPSDARHLRWLKGKLGDLWRGQGGQWPHVPAARPRPAEAAPA